MPEERRGGTLRGGGRGTCAEETASTEYEKEYVPPAPEEELRRLYEAGMNDKEIAAQLGCRPNAVYLWREERGLKSIWKTAKKRDDEKILRLYTEGFNDCEIAEETGVSKSVIWLWRDQRGLPPNTRKGRKKDE